jgi:hypothetical protein
MATAQAVRAVLFAPDPEQCDNADDSDDKGGDLHGNNPRLALLSGSTVALTSGISLSQGRPHPSPMLR